MPGSKTVLEIQHSGITINEIRERERDYQNAGYQVCWLFDLTDRGSGFDFKLKQGFYGAYCTFKWNHPRETVIACKGPVFFDFGEGSIFEVKRLYWEFGCHGWGNILSYDEFVREMKFNGAIGRKGAYVAPELKKCAKCGGMFERFTSYVDWNGRKRWRPNCPACKGKPVAPPEYRLSLMPSLVKEHESASTGQLLFFPIEPKNRKNKT